MPDAWAETENWTSFLPEARMPYEEDDPAVEWYAWVVGGVFALAGLVFVVLLILTLVQGVGALL